MTDKEVSLIKQKWCEDNRIPLSERKAIKFSLMSFNRRGNAVFLVSNPKVGSDYFEVVKQDLSGFSDNKTLSIPSAYRNDFDARHNKGFIAEWVNRRMGIGLLDTDITYLVSDKDYLTIIISPDSMRFKSSFRLIRL